MKKLSVVIALFLLAMPAFAQDEVVLSNSDIDALMGGGNRGGRGGRGNQNQPQIPDPIVWFADIKDLMKNNKVALDKNQEKALQAMLDKETVAMRTELEAGFARGNRGNNSAQMNMLTDLTAALTKHNTEFLTEVKAGLTPDQVSLITKAEKDKKVCSVALDLVNFQGVRSRTQQQNNNFRGGNAGGGLSDDLSELLGLPTGGAANRGTQNNQTTQFLQLIPDRVTCVQSNSTTAQRLAVLGDILTKGKKPFTPEQTTQVSALIEAKMKLITDELKAKYSNLDTMLNSLNQINNNNNQNQNRNNQNQTQTQTPPAPPTVNIATLTNNIVNTIMQNLGIQNPQNNNNNNNNNNQGGGRGGRGGGGGRGGDFPEGGRGGGGGNFTFPEGGRGGGGGFPEGGRGGNNTNNTNNNNFNPQQEIQAKTEELYDKVAAMLTPEQAKLVKKVKYDQMKARGAVDRYRAILEMEGTPLTPEQVTQIQTMLNTQNTAIRAAATTLVQKEIQALDPGAMQAVINEYLAQQAQQTQQQQNPQQNSRNNNNNNVNSVAQNRVAQQIIQKMLPEVSKQKALLEGATNAQIQTRVFTPQQVASYKLALMQ